MLMPKIAPYGSWKSPITPDLIASDSIRLEQVMIDGEDVYWIEMRPSEGGRYVIVRRSQDGKREDLIPADFNARTRVHEYGGGSYLASEGAVYFTNFEDQRLYLLEDDTPRPITPATDGKLRYADFVLDKQRQRIISVCEDHSDQGEAANSLVGIDIETGTIQPLASGNNFYSSPRLSPDGSWLAWLAWNHPNMPWDGTELWIARLEPDGTLSGKERVAGGLEESVCQPEWSPDGILHFVSDQTGWWNLYRWIDGNTELLFEKEAEFGRPQWVFGTSSYAFESADQIICAYAIEGSWHLARLDTKNHNLEPTEPKFEPFDIPYTEINYLRTMQDKIAFVGGSPGETTSIILFDSSSEKTEILRRSSEVSIDPGYVSTPQAIDFPTENGLNAHAFFYPPKNCDYACPPNEKPPLLVISHGGPTSATSSSLNLSIQYWTSHGIAVLDVNYGGSTGYGREYRERLKGQWGVVDVDDCVNGALYLAKKGDADHERLIIRGGSAGGYTTLSALTFRNTFKAGASYYGIGDLETLTKETHKFESRYLDKLVGPYPERQDIYESRSPINFVEKLSCPVIFFQGLEDKVVPPSQAESMYLALEKKGLSVAYVTFEGEQHGFRRAENIKRSLEAELYFYAQIFGFKMADPVKLVSIDNQVHSG